MSQSSAAKLCLEKDQIVERGGDRVRRKMFLSPPPKKGCNWFPNGPSQMAFMAAASDCRGAQSS